MTRLVNATAVEAPAKINLALHVVGRRDDGYHLLESLAVFTRFGDRIAVEAAESDSLVVHGPLAAGIPVTGDNLICRARDALRARFPDKARPVAIALEKRIPVTSGVGGGSSDAAATLRVLATLWKIDIDLPALAGIGVALGADVPMCLYRRPLVARGIGEAIEPLAVFPFIALVLVNPGVAVPTPAIFAALDDRSNPPLPPLPDDMSLAALLDWLARTRNDLMAPAMTLAPSIGAALQALHRQGALFSRMSGSGATCFGLFARAEQAEHAAASIRAERPEWFVTATSSSEGEA